jgi:hypothetical protein
MKFQNDDSIVPICLLFSVSEKLPMYLLPYIVRFKCTVYSVVSVYLQWKKHHLYGAILFYKEQAVEKKKTWHQQHDTSLVFKGTYLD